jgi:sterol desaturase/sphingolipid hydroxylase (fatty acid hydroxylase superfamily)
MESLWSPLAFLFEPQKRVYWLYILCSGLLILLFRHKITCKKIPLWSASYTVDLGWLVINQLLLKLWVVPFFALQVSAALWVNSTFVDLFGTGNFFKLSVPVFTVFFAFTLFVIDDFCKFIVHFSFHRLPFFWPFHAVHHSATTLTPLTLYRIHPVEFIVNSLRSFLVGAVLSGLFVYLFANTVSVFTIIGVNLFVFVFNLAGSNLRHSPFYLGFGRWEKYFISPAQHQIHHSIECKHFDKNFGSALAIWDRWFNCLLLSNNQSVSGFGLDKGNTNRQTMKQQWRGVRGK